MPDAIPTALEELGDRRFSFYPAIANTEHNEWLLRRATWSEILVANTKTGLEVWVPRRFVGEISSVGEPVVIIGLRKELELKAGSVWPRERRLLSMPRAGGGFLGSDATAENQPHAAGVRPSPGPEGKVGRLIIGALALGVGLLVLLVAVTQRPVTYKGVEQLALQLSGEDDYSSIVRKLGSPMDDHWRAAAGELQYRALRFRGRDYTLILMGADQKSAHYIGAMDSGWKPVHSVRLPDGGSTLAMLRRLPKF